jgi:hypothetical protein
VLGQRAFIATIFLANVGIWERLRPCALWSYGNSYGADERGSGVRLRGRMVPLVEWQSDDKAEMEAMLKKAARRDAKIGIDQERVGCTASSGPSHEAPQF